MTGFGPQASAPSASLWPATTAVSAPGFARGGDQHGSFWAVEITAGGGDWAGVAAPFGVVAGLPVGSFALPPGSGPVSATVRVSDRGWITEPDDPDAPNVSWPARLLEPPVIVLQTPIYPDESRRADTTAGEITLHNGDGVLDGLAPGWSLVGQRVVVRRGPVRSPRRAAPHRQRSGG